MPGRAQLYWWANGVLQRDTQPDRQTRQYVKGKPHPCDLKIWSRCSSSGILCDFAVYEGGTGKKSLLGMGGDVVVKLCETLPSDQNYKVFVENRFTSAPLVLSLLQRKITLRELCSAIAWLGVSLTTRKVLPREAEDLLTPGWKKKKEWSLSSGMTTNLLPWSHSTVHLSLKITLDTGAKQTFVEVSRPYIVKEYNTFMGGVDLLDACIARCKYRVRSRRWYIYLFWHTIMLDLANAWLIYQRDCNYLVSKTHWNKRVSRQRLSLASFFGRHKKAAHHLMPHLHDHHCSRGFVLEFQMKFALTKLHIGLWNVTSVAATSSAKSMQPPRFVRNLMCVFASLRNKTVSSLTIWPRLNG